MKIPITLTILALTAATLGCIESQKNESMQPSAAESSTKNVTTPYIQLSESEVSNLRQKVSSIRIGDTYAVAIAVLGSPTDEKVIRGKRIDAPVTGKILTYYITKLDRGLVNERTDKAITLVFDKDDRLTQVLGDLEETGDTHEK